MSEADAGGITINRIKPSIGIPGGEVTIYCDGLRPLHLEEDSLCFCGSPSHIEGASTHKLVTHIPETVNDDQVYFRDNGNRVSNIHRYTIPECIAQVVHHVGNPAVSNDGEIFATFSGTSGQLTPVSVFRVIDAQRKVPIISGIMNATSLYWGHDNSLYITSRYDGTLYSSDAEGNFHIFSQGLGEAFGICMDSKGALFVGDRSGTVFKVDGTGRADFFARLPASPIAYHLAIDSKDNLFVTAPLQIGENSIYKIDPAGNITLFLTDLAEFHGIAIDSDDAIFVAETNRGRGSVMRIDPESRERRCLLSGEDVVGLVFAGNGDLLLATFSRLYRLTAAQVKKMCEEED